MVSAAQDQKGQPYQREAQRSRRTHAIGADRRHRARRLGRQQLVNAKTPAREVLDESQQTYKQRERRANPCRPASSRSRLCRDQQHQGHTDQRQAKSRVGFHGDGGQAALRQVAAEPGG